MAARPDSSSTGNEAAMESTTFVVFDAQDRGLLATISSHLRMASYFSSPATSHPPFEYADISAKARTFRLITLLPPLPAAFPFGSPTVRIEISEANVDEAAFEALSYTWGVTTSAPDRPVIVETPDGPRKIRIYRSLEDTLLELSTPGNKTVQLPIFVDQISINQKDADEKGVQVQLMGDVYAKCKRVLVWLGPGTAKSDKYFDFVLDVCYEGVLERFMGPRSVVFPQIFDAVMDSSVVVTGEDESDRDEVLDLISRLGDRFPIDGAIDVLGRAWFTRLWIIQEACLAPELTFVTGSRALCYNCFRVGLLFYTIYNTHWVRHVEHAVPQEEVRQRELILDLNQNVIRIVQERRAIHALGSRQSFADLVRKYNVNNDGPKIGASLAEDRLFGFLGISARDVFWAGVRVSYADVKAVYCDFAAVLLRELPDFLAYSQFPKKVEGLPSWVPDWSSSLLTARGYVDLKTPAFSAGGHGAAEGHRYDSKAKSLTLQGVLVDRVFKIGVSSMTVEHGPTLLSGIEHMSAKTFFDEIDAFIKQASTIERSPLHEASEEVRHLTKIRLSDFGVTEKYFIDTEGPEEANRLLLAVHQEVDRWGKKLIDVERTAKAHQLHRFLGLIDYRTAQHWAPPAETDALTLAATDPVTASTALLRGVASICADIGGAARAAIHLSLLRVYLRVRRHFTSMSFSAMKNSPDVYKAVGLDPGMAHTMELKAYRDNLIRNTEQRVYLTENGSVGVGPPEMKPGDAVVVFIGATVPHVLRSVEDKWQYLGETYCAGIMEGEALQGSDVRREFMLV
ncbi:heterokaryon incompatibility protein [Plectosphaerella plurivora]|uniref:Heterokaryon incompatibility protein n=1 Tax=Plectosphaerella plurivora TaxID=936078 RepID=A0A9P8V999_9PEZI|nr:heterokaryon incompatibility protein [Plectosphaerella plurivora]